MKVAILGAGAWGTALAIAYSEEHAVTLWARDGAQREALRTARRSRYLPEVALPGSVAVEDDPLAAIRGADAALIATPTAGLRYAAGLVHHAAVWRPVIWVCKGFEQSSGKLPHQVIAEVLGATAPGAALSGPSFALEVARGLPTAVTLAAADADFARDLARELHQRRLRIYFTDDLVGVEVGGAVKNVMAIATGISDGLGLGLNARAALITRGLAEVARLGVALGGRPETFMGLAGAGDLILTCTGDLSRNRRVGLALGRGEKLDAILAGLGHVAEGVHTAREVDVLARSRGIEMPITREVCAVLFEGRAPAEAVAQLLARDPRAESPAPRPRT
jgi:glycerol-3-phosphate dehydrogenase (NAD(P)+)